MRFSSFVAAVIAASPFIASAFPYSSLGSGNSNKTPTSYCPSIGYISPGQQLQLFQALYAQIATGDIAGAFAKYISPNLTEHSATIETYAQDVSFLTLLSPTVNQEILHQGCFGDICIVHAKATPKPNSPFVTNVTAAVDLYRYQGSCIVEHWDALQAADASTTNPKFPN